MQILKNSFFIPLFFLALHVSNEFSRSSSGARHNILYYTARYNRAGQSRLACTVVPIVLCNAVYQAVLLIMNEKIPSKHVQQTKNCGIKKIVYKNCASCWLSTHCIMMHVTHSVKLLQFLFSTLSYLIHYCRPERLMFAKKTIPYHINEMLFINNSTRIIRLVEHNIYRYHFCSS